jgi:hypothetical protein
MKIRVLQTTKKDRIQEGRREKTKSEKQWIRQNLSTSKRGREKKKGGKKTDPVAACASNGLPWKATVKNSGVVRANN